MITPENYKDLVCEYRELRNFARFFTLQEFEFHINTRSPYGEHFLKYFRKFDPEHIAEQVQDFALLYFGQKIDYKLDE
jgi:hypothetical protein